MFLMPNQKYIIKIRKIFDIFLYLYSGGMNLFFLTTYSNTFQIYKNFQNNFRDVSIQT